MLGAVLALHTGPAVATEASDTDIRIEVRAEIAGRCGFSTPPATSLNGLRIDLAQTIALPFVIDCNEPFRIGVESAHGAVLRRDGASAGGFRTARTYETELRVETDEGALTPAACVSSSLTDSSQAVCAFAQRGAEGGVSSGDRIATNRPGQLIVRWPNADQDGARFAPGNYGDVITLRLSRSL